LTGADRIRAAQTAEVDYQTMQRTGFRRAEGWKRKYTLRDARQEADYVARELRTAWELMDPISA
jgi:hypothetical protein